MTPARIARLALLALLLPGSLACAADAAMPAGAQQAIERAYPDLVENLPPDFAVGDLNGDGVDDVAALIQYDRDDTRYERLLVLAGARDGKFRIAAQSAPWQMLMRRETSVAIKKASIFLTGRGNSYTSYWTATYQFRAGDGGFRMIGVSSATGEVGEDDNRREQSINLLTGKVIEAVVNQKRRKETSRALKSARQPPLSGFSFDDEPKFE